MGDCKGSRFEDAVVTAGRDPAQPRISSAPIKKAFPATHVSFAMFGSLHFREECSAPQAALTLQNDGSVPG